MTSRGALLPSVLLLLGALGCGAGEAVVLRGTEGREITSFVQCGAQRLALVSDVRVDPARGAYALHPAAAHEWTWLRVVRDAGAWRAAEAFSAEERQLAGLDRVVRGGSQVLLASVGIVDGSGTVQQWMLHPDGSTDEAAPYRFPLLRNAFGAVATIGDQLLLPIDRRPAGLQSERTVLLPDDQRAIVRFADLAPWPRGDDVPLMREVPAAPNSAQPPIRLQNGFSQWLNAGRRDAPAPVVGEGLHIVIGGVARVLGTAHGLPSARVSVVAPGVDGSAWVGFHDARPVRVDLRSGAVLARAGEGAPRDASALLAEPGVLWIGSFTRGLFRADASGTGCVVVAGLDGRRIDVLARDDAEAQTMWVGTDRGLVALETVR